MIASKIIIELKEELKNRLNKFRYEHVLSVEKIALELQLQYDLDSTKMQFISLYHDYAKNLSTEVLYDYSLFFSLDLLDFEKNSHDFLHGKISAMIACKKYLFIDKDIFNAIYYHTTGRARMSKYEKILFISDYCDPLKKRKNQKEILESAFKSLDYSVFKVFYEKIQFVLNQKKILHPISIEGYNFYSNILKSK